MAKPNQKQSMQRIQVWLSESSIERPWRSAWHLCGPTDGLAQLVAVSPMERTPAGGVATVRSLPPRSGWCSAITWAHHKDLLVASGIALEFFGTATRTDHGRVTAERVRSLTPQRLITAARYGMSALEGAGMISAVSTEQFVDSWDRDEQVRGRPRLYPDEHWREVAEVVMTEQARGGRHWVRAVQEQVPDRDGQMATTAQAKRWVQRAREMGLLP